MTLPLAIVPPLLVLGWGNRSRGDDALGPMCIESLRAAVGADADVEFLEDYQLQVEHALDLVGRARVLFVDASASCQTPFEVTTLRAAQDASITTHTLSAQALLHLFVKLRGETPPPSTLLAIRGEGFGLGEPLSDAARSNLQQALGWCGRWLNLKIDC